MQEAHRTLFPDGSPLWDLEDAVDEAIGLIQMLSHLCQSFAQESEINSVNDVALAGMLKLARSTSERLLKVWRASDNYATGRPS